MKKYRHVILSSIAYLLSSIIMLLIWIPAIIYNTLLKKIKKNLTTKIYYILIAGKQKGPYDISELKKKNINKDTPIYFNGLPEWTTVEYVKELSEIHVLPNVQTERENIINPSYTGIRISSYDIQRLMIKP